MRQFKIIGLKRKKGWILKLDLEKACDRVDWGFLEKVLHCKRFSSKWSTWRLDCLKNPRFSIFINGKSRGRIVASRGIRQGGPFSPFLFLLVSEVLGTIINKLYTNGHFEGFMVGKENVHIPSSNTRMIQSFSINMMRPCFSN